MRYDITKPVRPKMPKPGKGLEIVKLLQSQVSKTMHEPLAPTYFPSLGAHINGCEFMYPSGVWMEPCGLIAHLCAEFSGNKGQLGLLAEAICRDFRAHDEESDRKLKDWDKVYKWRSKLRGNTHFARSKKFSRRAAECAEDSQRLCFSTAAWSFWSKRPRPSLSSPCRGMVL